jgi:hypothetical protein
MRIQKIGGFSSIVLGCILAIYVVLVLLGVVQTVGWEDPVKALEAAASTSPVTQIIGHLLSVIGGITVVLIVLAVRDRMAIMAPNLMRIVVIGGSIGGALWLTATFTEIAGVPAILNAKDSSAYMAVMALTDGLLGASEFALGWALLLIACVALEHRDLTKMLCYILALKGAVMIVTFGVSALQTTGAVLGIISYPWLGVMLMRNKS